MEDYIIFNNDDDMTTYTMLMEAYTDEADIIQEGKLLDEAIGKGKQEHILIKIFKFLPRLVRGIGRMIRDKLRDHIIDKKIKAIEKWLAEEHVKESYEYDGEDHIIYTEAGRPMEDLIKYNDGVEIPMSTSRFKKLDKLAIELVNEIKSCPDIASEMAETIGRLSDVYARASRDGYDYMKNAVRMKNGMKPKERETTEEIARKFARDSNSTLDPHTVTRYAINPKDRRELYDAVMSGDISENEARSKLREEKQTRYLTGDNTLPADVQHECHKLEKRIDQHSQMIVRIAKDLVNELNAVKKIQTKSTKDPKKAFVQAFHYAKKQSAKELLIYINNIRKNMLFCSIELDKSARILDKCNMAVLNPSRHIPMAEIMGHVKDSVVMIKNDYDKISKICAAIVNFLVDEINTLFEITGADKDIKRNRKKEREYEKLAVDADTERKKRDASYDHRSFNDKMNDEQISKRRELIRAYHHDLFDQEKLSDKELESMYDEVRSLTKDINAEKHKPGGPNEEYLNDMINYRNSLVKEIGLQRRWKKRPLVRTDINVPSRRDIDKDVDEFKRERMERYDEERDRKLKAIDKKYSRDPYGTDYYRKYID